MAGLAQGEDPKTLFNIGVSLAVGSIPDALPAVVTLILSVGTVNMARKHAIMKSLPAVETLGSTSAINSDKTGTLTMNQMTVREITTAAHHYTVSGQGYSFDGQVQRTAGDAEANLDYVMFPCALCNDSDISEGAVVGDPTEGALYVLAQKGGVDVKAFRQNHPRVASVPFDSDYKFMATFHAMPGARRHAGHRAYVKGAPDVILDRSAYARMPGGVTAPLTDEMRAKVTAENERIAGQGMRVLAFAQREFDPGHLRPLGRPDGADDGPRDGRARRRGRPAPRGGEGGHRRGQGRRHPGADDHRRPCRDRGRHRPRAGHRGPRRDRRRVRRAERRGGRPGGRRHRRLRARRPGAQGPAGRGAAGGRATSSR